MSFEDVLAKMQAEVENPTKNAQNSHLKNRYADLSEVLSVTSPILQKYSGTVITGPSYHENGVQNFISEITVLDADGARVKKAMEFGMPLQKADPQGFGSALTYARRYALCAWFNIVQEDDDGNVASGVGKRAAPRVDKTINRRDTVPLDAARVIKAFDEATDSKGFEAAAKLFTQLEPAEQAAVVGPAGAARARLGIAKAK